MKNKLIKRLKMAAVLEMALAVGIISFWIAFFSTDLVTISDPHLKEIYLAFESAFPVPDAYLSAVLLIGGVGLLRKKAYGRFFSLIGGASLVFLGLLDISFNTRHGIYLIGAGEAIMNIFINLLCLGTGVFLILTIWKYRLD
jgi:arginine exporter protein ArgO